jgi:eukaryotic-like serine/threonine-protein kinase
MPLAIGSRLGPYEIVAPLGAGAMGEVYKARDTRLDRFVAIKVLPAAVADDAQRRERFRREARAISTLTHPHICTLHDVGEHDGVDFLVMEYLAGETLAQRLLRGALPLEQVVRIAAQIADGLAAAHQHGIVHRDLKPSNVMLTPGGAKMLDFGLAKRGTEADGAIADSALLAAPATITHPGTIVGTVQYMAPEQLEGKPADARSDIFAFGAIVYEMATGRKAFAGTSHASIMAEILSATPPPLTDVEPTTPVALDRVVHKCLAKDPVRRWQHAADLHDELAWIESDLVRRNPRTTNAEASRQPSRTQRVMFVVAGLAIASIAIGIASRVGVGAGTSDTSQPTFKLLTFRRGWIQTARFAPDGQTIVYSAAWDGKPLELFATRRDSSEARSLGLPSASIESISSAGDMAIILGCRDAPECHDGVLARAPLAGGPPRELLEHVPFADWAPDGSQLAVIHIVDGRSRLEYPIGRVLYQPGAGAELEHVRISHSGQRVAFSEILSDGRRHVLVTDLEGRRTEIVPPFEYLFVGPEWSATDEELWFTRSSGGNPSALYAANLRSAAVRLVERLPQAMMLREVGRDGRLLVAMAAEPRWSRLVGRAPNDSNDRDFSALTNPHLAGMSDDGRSIFFDDNAYGVHGGVRGVYLRRTDQAEAVRLGDGEAIALSRDGRLALVRPFGPPARLMVLPTGPGEPRQLPGPYDDWRIGWWLPDNKRFVMNAREPGRAWRAYLQDIDGSPPRPLTPEHVEPLLLSADGQSVLASGPDRARTLALYPIEAGAVRPVRGLDDGDAPVAWCADPRFLFVRAAGLFPARIFRFDLETGRRVPWKELQPADAAGLFYAGPVDGSNAGRLRITPDGRGYAYGYLRVLADLFLVDGLK